ncbi:transcriptional regulator with XRE-family HTH domain [Rhodococcus sp. 27YEA15]|uniref:helix-turn-helix domain-containing protein n=1 Tax=Rhodococcus sp. 27YEA15 TaxID=3156259 RepID=UPI003C7A9A29
MVTLSQSVAAQVKSRRKARGMTVVVLAQRAGISVGSLSAVESGRGNPTLETLNALALALAIPLTDLIAEPVPETAHVVADVFENAVQAHQVLHRLSGAYAIEITRTWFPPGRHFVGIPHTQGSVEYVFLVSGTVTAGPTNAQSTLAASDLLIFPGTVPHEYTAGDEGAEIVTIIATPNYPENPIS